MSEISIITKTLYGEARGSTYFDRMAIGAVIQNRAKIARDYCKRYGKTKHPLFGTGTLKSACLMPKQFSCWNKKDPNYKIICHLDIDQALKKDPIFQECWQIASNMIRSQHDDITKGALYYHTIQMGWPMAWGKYKKADCQIGAHSYYRSLC